MSADRIKFGKSEFPLGKEGVAKTVDMVNQVIFRVNPSLESVADNLITKPSQIEFLSASRLNDKRIVSLRDRFIFSLFQKLGVPDETLLAAYLPPGTLRLVYFEHGYPPCLYLDENIKGGFNMNDPIKRALAGLKLGGLMIQTNFNLSTEPIDVPSHFRTQARIIARTHLYGNLLTEMALSFGDQVDPLAFETAGSIISSLESRLVAHGGTLRLLLPNQSVDNAEVVVGGDLHAELVLYYAKETLEKFMRLMVTSGFTMGAKLTIPKEVTAAAASIRDKLERLNDHKLDKSFEAFRRSQLPFVLID